MLLPYGTVVQPLSKRRSKVIFPLLASCSGTFLKAIGTPGFRRIRTEGGTSSVPILSEPSVSLSITCSLSGLRELSCSSVWPATSSWDRTADRQAAQLALPPAGSTHRAEAHVRSQASGLIARAYPCYPSASYLSSS